MSRREDSKRERIRAEEEALNKQLQDAGLYEEGMGLEEKRTMLQLLEESRASAQQEAKEREQWRQQEEQILNETLNKSFKDNSEEDQQSAIGSSIQDNEDNSRDSDVVAIPSGSDKHDVRNSGNTSDCGSVTPDLSPPRPGSPELLVPSLSPRQEQCPVRPTTSKGKSSNITVKEKTKGSSQNSDEDLFCDSQSSDQFVNRRKHQECVVTESESHAKVDSKAPLSSPGRRRQVQQKLTVVRTVERRTFIVEENNSEPLEAQRSIRRRYSVEEVPSESDKFESRVSSFSQPLFSSGEDNTRKQRRVSEDEDGIQLLSPVIGQRSVSSRSASSGAKQNNQTLQDAEVSNSVEAEPIRQIDAVMLEDSDDDDFVLPSPSVSQSTSSNQIERLSSTPVGCKSQKIQETEKSKPPSQERHANDISDKVDHGKNTEVDCCVDSQSPRHNLKKTADGAGNHNMEISDSDDEDHSFNYQNDRKRNVNVFCPQDNSDIPLKRRRKMTIEDRKVIYFKSNEETLDDCFKRILGMISQDMERLEQNQSSLSYRLKWMPPVVVDRRVKDSLDRPGAHNRRKAGGPAAGSSEREMPHRATRYITRTMETQEEESQYSEDSLPDLCSLEEQNLVPQNKRILKRRSLHLGLSQKRAKLASLLENKESENSEKVACDSEEEFENDSIFPLKNTQRSNERFLHQNKSSKTSQEVSSSKSLETRNNECDSEEGNMFVVSQASDEECTVMEKPSPSEGQRQEIEQPSVLHKTPKGSKGSSEVRNLKRPSRKTFLLCTPEDAGVNRDCDSASSSTVQGQAQSEIREQVPYSDEPSTSGIQLMSEVKTPMRSRERGKTKHTSVNSSNKRMKPLNFVSSSRNDDTVSQPDKDVQAGPSSNVDICILDDNNPATTTSSLSSSNQAGRSGTVRREKSEQPQIRPAPLKFRKTNSREKGAENASRGEEEKDTEQITSSIALQRQVPNGQFLEDAREEEEEDSNMVPCPLCGKQYPMKQIEIHASDCVEKNDLQQEQVVPSTSRQSKRKVIKPTQTAEDEEDMEIEEVMEMRAESLPTVVGRARTPPGKVRCTYCKVVMKEGDDYLIHVQTCIEKQQIQDSIMSPSSASTPAGKSGFKRVGVSQSQGLGVPSAKARSLFDHLEGGLVCVRGDITAPEYSNIHTALVQILNCVAIRPHGLSEVLAKKYPYSDLYSRRRQVKNYNRSVVEDRPKPGTIGICRPRAPSHGPIVVDVFGQFYMGKERNRNLMNKRLAKTLQDTNNSSERDPQLLEGLLEDTTDNRIKWFREALEQLAEQVVKEGIKHVVFPFSIGCGLAGGNWERNYFPAIKNFAEKVKALSVKVTIVQKTNEQKSDNDVAIIGTVKKTVVSGGSSRRGRGAGGKYFGK
ncbi:uro-adherence factor A [Penaeus vannamei]|uniref:uro-adherence factor A n=1 Tax=Penaeus vannamei TaxID=6689 RepID=UPI00387F39A8